MADSFRFPILPNDLQVFTLNWIRFQQAEKLFKINRTLRNLYLRRGKLFSNRIDKLTIDFEKGHSIQENGEALRKPKSFPLNLPPGYPLGYPQGFPSKMPLTIRYLLAPNDIYIPLEHTSLIRSAKALEITQQPADDYHSPKLCSNLRVVQHLIINFPPILFKSIPIDFPFVEQTLIVKKTISNELYLSSQIQTTRFDATREFYDRKELCRCQNFIFKETPCFEGLAESVAELYFVTLAANRFECFHKTFEYLLQYGLPGKNPKSNVFVVIDLFPVNQTFSNIISNYKSSDIKWIDASSGEFRYFEDIQLQKGDIGFEGILDESAYLNLQSFIAFEKFFQEINLEHLTINKTSKWKVYLKKRIDANRELILVLRFAQTPKDSSYQVQLLAKYSED